MIWWMVTRFRAPVYTHDQPEYVGEELLVPDEFNVDPTYVPASPAHLLANNLIQKASGVAGVTALDSAEACRRVISVLTREKADFQQLLISNPDDPNSGQRISDINTALEAVFGGDLWKKAEGPAVLKNSWYTAGGGFKKSVRSAARQQAIDEENQRQAGRRHSSEEQLEHTRRVLEIDRQHELEHQAPFVGAIFKSCACCTPQKEWKITGFLGAGSFGEAWSAEDRTGLTPDQPSESEVCIKTLRHRPGKAIADCAKEAKLDFDRSASLLQTLCAGGGNPAICNIQFVTPPGHPGRVTIVDRYPDTGTPPTRAEEERVHGWCHFIVMDLCKCELFQYTKDMWGGEKGCKSGKFQEHFARPLFRSVCTPHTSLCPSFENQVVSPLPQGVASERRVLARPWLLPQRHQER